uniref:Reverse transcriptase domain-containing protein n=1 Tax=Amphimedon queenslandica TaxID=400682 RepID=A0A1X7SXG4_AMPQE
MPKMATGSDGRCCSCNNPRSTCQRCSCVKKQKPCLSCKPGSESRCRNPYNVVTIPLEEASSSSGPSNQTVPPRDSPSDSLPSSPDVTNSPHSSISLFSPNTTLLNAEGVEDDNGGHYLDNLEIESILSSAYGSSLHDHSDPPCHPEWHARWKTITQLSASHYFLPKGQCGRRYIGILCDEIDSLLRWSSTSERVLVFSSVILQRDKQVTKRRDVIRSLNRRMDMWRDDKFDLLVQESCRCDRSFTSHRRRKHDKDYIEKVFTRLMLQGKVRAAMRWLTDRSKGSILSPSDKVTMSVNGARCETTVIDALKSKHPSSHSPHSSTLLTASPLPLLEDIEITGSHVGLVARRIQGSAGPCGCDSAHWQDILCRFGASSRRLCDSIAGLSRSLSNSLVDWSRIQALLANRLIALDKQPGIRPIGIGETLRRIICKVVCMVTRDDATSVCGTEQLCAGLKCGIEGAIHTATELFDSHDDDFGVLIMDASNAFNSINRLAMLWNIRILWPRASRFIFNTYRGRSSLLLKGSVEVLYSCEGVVQGDPLSMFMYAVATLPLIRSLSDSSPCLQLWYADDSSALGAFDSIKSWLDSLSTTGPLFGYHPEPRKSYLIVKEATFDHATALFEDYGVNVVTSRRFLGGVIGSTTERDLFVSHKVEEWSHTVELLASIAIHQPQAAYVALTKSLQCEWTFLQRVIPPCSHLFQAIENSLSSSFIPNLLGHECSKLDRLVYSLPTKLGGLNIPLPTLSTTLAYESSLAATSILSDAIKGSITFSLSDHEGQVLQSRSDFSKLKLSAHDNTLSHIIDMADPIYKRAILRNCKSLPSWLNALPIQQEHFDLSANEFRDALCLRYLKPLLNTPTNCDGCNAPFTTSHALDCRRGGLVVQRHNEIRDFIFDISSMVWSQTIKEPM